MPYQTYKSIAEMQSELKKWSPAWGNHVSTRAIIYACERLDEIAALLRRPTKKSKPSAWNVFFARGMKAGKSPSQIGREWKESKKK